MLKLTKRIICGTELYYPNNELANLFLELIQIRHAKTFTKDQLVILAHISNILGFEILVEKIKEEK